jgi:hypothetical protein
MDLGICKFRHGAGPLAERLGARWAHWRTNLVEEVPDDTDLIAEAIDHGLTPVVDLFTKAQAVVEYAIGLDTVMVPADWPPSGLTTYAKRIVQYLDRHPQVTTIEVWGSAELVRLIKGKGKLLDYSRMLQFVYAYVKQCRPDVTLLSGGYETSFETGFVVDGLTMNAPDSFDLCNLQPFLACRPPYVAAAVSMAAQRLDIMRDKLNRLAGAQQFCSTGFGVPSIAIEPPPAAYGRFWRVPGAANAMPELEALEWYTGFLELMTNANFRFCCLLLEDYDDEFGARYIQWCGLLRRDGTEKAFLPALAEWWKSRAASAA